MIALLRQFNRVTDGVIFSLLNYLIAVLLLLMDVVYANLIHYRYRFINYSKLQCCNWTVLT